MLLYVILLYPCHCLYIDIPGAFLEAIEPCEERVRPGNRRNTDKFVNNVLGNDIGQHFFVHRIQNDSVISNNTVRY